jgi:hypothetical protein
MTRLRSPPHTVVGMDSVMEVDTVSGVGHGGRARIGGKFRRSHFGGPSRAFSRGFAGQHFPAAHGRFGRARRFAPGVDDRFYDYGCSYSYYDRYSCYLPAY